MRSNVSFPLVMMIAEIGALRNRDGEVRDERGLLDVIKAWSDAGVNVIQIRGGGHTDRELVEFVRRVQLSACSSVEMKSRVEWGRGGVLQGQGFAVLLQLARFYVIMHGHERTVPR